MHAQSSRAAWAEDMNLTWLSSSHDEVVAASKAWPTQVKECHAVQTCWPVGGGFALSRYAL